LLELFHNCPRYASRALPSGKHTIGSMWRVQQHCFFCGFYRTWESQPMIGAIPAGNLLMSSAILFSGLLKSKAQIAMVGLLLMMSHDYSLHSHDIHGDNFMNVYHKLVSYHIQ